MIGGSSYLSRIAVVFAFPTAILCGYLNQFVWLFKRKRGISREWFTEFFRKNWAVRYSFSLILYYVVLIVVLLFILKVIVLKVKDVWN